VPVIAVIGANQQRQFVRLGAQFRVKDPEAAVNALVKANFQAKATPLMDSHL